MTQPDQPPNPAGEDRGAPAGDETPSAADVDPELVNLKPSRPRRSPVVALAVIALGGLLLAHLRADLRYAISPARPTELGDARSLGTTGFASLPSDRYAALAGLPDYRNALLFEPKGDPYRRAFFRLLGTDSRLLVRAEETATRHQLSERFVGRLRRFAEIPFADQVRAYYGKLRVTRLVERDAFFAQLARIKPGTTLAAIAGSEGLIDGAGEHLRVGEGEKVQLTVDFPDQLEVMLSKESFAVEEDARHELERLGATIAGAGVAGREDFQYVVTVGPLKERDAYIAKLDAKEFRFKAHRRTVDAKLGDFGPASLDAAAGAVQVPGIGAVKKERLASIQIEAPIEIPADAVILVEGEAPGDYLWAPLVAGLLGLFLLFNLWLLFRSLRRAA